MALNTWLELQLKKLVLFLSYILLSSSHKPAKKKQIYRKSIFLPIKIKTKSNKSYKNKQRRDLKLKSN